MAKRGTLDHPKTRHPRSIPAYMWHDIRKRPCAVCKCPIGSCVDHIIPVCQGGTADSANLQPLCSRCNNYKRGAVMTNGDIAQRVCRAVLRYGARGYFGNYRYRRDLPERMEKFWRWQNFMYCRWDEVLWSVVRMEEIR